MLEAEVGIVPAHRDPAELAGLVAVDRVPHDLADEAADLLEALPAVELRHPGRHLVAPPLGDEHAGPPHVGLAGTGPDPGVRLHPRDQPRKIAGRQVEVEVELAEIGIVGERHGRESA
jgi:hypothetical protein